MTSGNENSHLTVWKETPLIWLSFLAAGVMLLVLFFDALAELVRVWDRKEEYSYGYLIPVIALFLIWQKKEELERTRFTGSWAGPVIIVIGLALFAVGQLSTLYLIVQYSFLIVLAGMVLAFTGTAGFKTIRVPLLVLVFMIPLPSFFLQEISQALQLASSELGVAVIRLFGISVFLEGNVIDLGTFKLQVIEACNGLRYLFPLMTLGFIAAYFFKVAFWKRAVIFLSTIPITILMNSFRIGMIGVMVEHWGPSMAEGFLHDFEGWVIFMACTAVLMLEMWLLARIGAEPRPLREVFGLDFPAALPSDAEVKRRTIGRSYLTSLAILMIATVAAAAMPKTTDIIPDRNDFGDFPLVFDEWQGRSDRLETIYLDALKLDDYVLADFVDSNNHGVNFYVAYYGSQKTGESAHSPRTCIPGGGWKIAKLEQVPVETASFRGQPLRVNRAVIQKGEHKQLVYYWFQQRGRNLTNEYLVKWYIFWDALTQRRTDGALVRTTTVLYPGEDLTAADKRLASFVRAALPRLEGHIPN